MHQLSLINDCRELMSEAAKEDGNRRSKKEPYKGAVDRYSLALALNPGNLVALSNRTRIHLLVCIPISGSFDVLSVSSFRAAVMSTRCLVFDGNTTSVRDEASEG